jgi:hypothetical protein
MALKGFWIQKSKHAVSLSNDLDSPFRITESNPVFSFVPNRQTLSICPASICIQRNNQT